MHQFTDETDHGNTCVNLWTEGPSIMTYPLHIHQLQTSQVCIDTIVPAEKLPSTVSIICLSKLPIALQQHSNC